MIDISHVRIAPRRMARIDMLAQGSGVAKISARDVSSMSCGACADNRALKVKKHLKLARSI